MSTEWVQTFQPAPGARLRLLCFTYAGGPTRLYQEWGAALGPEVEVAAVALPGRERRRHEPSFSRMDPLVAALTQGVAGWLDRPFALFGHSLGALIAYELACRLRAEGRAEPLHLLVSGRPAPDFAITTPMLHALPDDRLVSEVQRIYGGIPAAVLRERELLQMMIPSLRADLAVVETYVHRERPPLELPITALTGSADPVAPERAMAQWRRHTARRFEQVVVPGDHFFVQGAPRGVLALVRARLTDPAAR